MNKKAIYNQVLDFFSNLELPWDHFANDLCESYNDIFEDFFNSKLPKNLSDGVQYHTGASKWVIDIKGFEFIIKIPYEGYYDEVEDEDYDDCKIFDSYEEEEAYIESHHHIEFCPFEGADCGNYWDYCAAEMAVYDRAMREGISNLFAKTLLFCRTKDGHPVYIQKRAINYWDCDDKTRRSRNYDKACNMSYYSSVPPEFLALVLDMYGEKVANALLKFCADYNIGDLHLGNVGIRKNSRMPVLYDYSSFDS